MCGYPDIWKSGIPDFRISGFPDIRKSEIPDPTPHLLYLAGGNHPCKHPRKNIRASAHQEASAPEGISRHPRIPENRAGATNVRKKTDIRISGNPEFRKSGISDIRKSGFPDNHPDFRIPVHAATDVVSIPQAGRGTEAWDAVTHLRDD